MIIHTQQNAHRGRNQGCEQAVGRTIVATCTHGPGQISANGGQRSAQAVPARFATRHLIFADLNFRNEWARRYQQRAAVHQSCTRQRQRRSPAPPTVLRRDVTMNVSSLSAVSSVYSNDATQSANSPRSLFAQLSQDLRSGNLSAAQSTFASLQTFFQQAGTSSAGGGTTVTNALATALSTSSTPGTTTPSTTSVSNAVANLSQALQSGNLGSAQAAFAQLAQSTRTGSGAGGHHHHHGGGHRHAAPAPSSSTSTTSASTSSSSSDASSTTQSLQDATSPVSSATSGDSSGSISSSARLLNVLA